MTWIQVSNTLLFAPAGSCCAVPSCTSQTAQDAQYAGTECQSATPLVRPTSGAPGSDIIVSGSSLPPCRCNTINAQNDHWNPQDSGRPRVKDLERTSWRPGVAILVACCVVSERFQCVLIPLSLFPGKFKVFPWEVFPWKVFPWKVFP